MLRHINKATPPNSTASVMITRFLPSISFRAGTKRAPTLTASATAATTIYGAMANNLKPLIAGEEATCKGCGIATLTISYYDLGYATGKMAVKILKGEEKIENMPVEYAATFTKKYNKTICDELGIDTAALEAAGYVAIQ